MSSGDWNTTLVYYDQRQQNHLKAERCCEEKDVVDHISGKAVFQADKRCCTQNPHLKSAPLASPPSLVATTDGRGAQFPLHDGSGKRAFLRTATKGYDTPKGFTLDLEFKLSPQGSECYTYGAEDDEDGYAMNPAKGEDENPNGLASNGTRTKHGINSYKNEGTLYNQWRHVIGSGSTDTENLFGTQIAENYVHGESKLAPLCDGHGKGAFTRLTRCWGDIDNAKCTYIGTCDGASCAKNTPHTCTNNHRCRSPASHIQT